MSCTVYVLRLPPALNYSTLQTVLWKLDCDGVDKHNIEIGVGFHPIFQQY